MTSTSAVLSPIPATPSAVFAEALDGDQLAAAVAALAKTGAEILVVANGFTGCVFQRASATDAWAPSCRGELAAPLIEASAPQRAKKRMYWAHVEGSPVNSDPCALAVDRPAKKDLQRWLRDADELTGREGEISAKTREEVAYLAGWRCQFAGCGLDLHKHVPTGRSGRLSYYAHIVASSPKGPRGHDTRSALLADEPDNIMLLCDGCHRLIDRIDPDYYTEQMLVDMRSRSVAEVRHLLDSLKYPEAEPIAIIGPIAGQVPQFSMRDAEPAMWQSHLRSASHRPEYLFHIDPQLHDVHTPEYWAAVFRAMKSDANQLQRLLNGTQRGGGPRPRLAVFPVHTTSVMLVAGRILGETGGTHLFQPHRSVAAGVTSTRWVWPPREQSRQADKFRVRELKGHEVGATEANLIVSLTFSLAPERLPAKCFDAATGTLTLPTVEVFVEPEDHSIHVINAPEDLEELGKALDKAIRTLHDEWRVGRVNLFIGAPATAVVTMGQKMQARYQATYVCHETKAGERDGIHLPTIEISSTQVFEPRSGQFFELQP